MYNSRCAASYYPPACPLLFELLLSQNTVHYHLTLTVISLVQKVLRVYVILLKMVKLILFVIFTVIILTTGQLQHIAVIENDAFEQTLPNELRNPFYKTPRVREALAYHSWFGPGEKPVFDRQSEKIPRSEIYSVLSHAGLIPRRLFFR